MVWCNHYLEICAKEEVNKGDFWSGMVKEDESVNVGPKCNFWGLDYIFFLFTVF